MRKSFLACLVATAAASAGVRAAEPAAPRELLQPPKETIASPITDRFALRGIYQRADVATQLRYDNAAGGLGTVLSGEQDWASPVARTRARSR